MMGINDNQWKHAFSSQVYKGSTRRSFGMTKVSDINNVPDPLQLRADVTKWFNVAASRTVKTIPTYGNFDPTGPGAVLICGNIDDDRGNKLGQFGGIKNFEFCDIFNPHLTGTFANTYPQYWSSEATKPSHIRRLGSGYYTKGEVCTEIKQWKQGSHYTNNGAAGYEVWFDRAGGALQSVYGFAGLYDDRKNRIPINAECGDGSVLIHEFMHSCQKLDWSAYTGKKLMCSMMDLLTYLQG